MPVINTIIELHLKMKLFGSLFWFCVCVCVFFFVIGGRLRTKETKAAGKVGETVKTNCRRV